MSNLSKKIRIAKIVGQKWDWIQAIVSYSDNSLVFSLVENDAGKLQIAYKRRLTGKVWATVELDSSDTLQSVVDKFGDALEDESDESLIS